MEFLNNRMNTQSTFSDNRTIIFYDGVCNLCNGLVQFILRKDTHRKFRYIAIQGQAGKDLLKRFRNPDDALRTVIVISGDSVYFRSRAIFKIFQEIGGIWKIVLIFKIFPVRINDFIYDIIAKNRYKIFGKNKECIIIE